MSKKPILTITVIVVLGTAFIFLNRQSPATFEMLTDGRYITEPQPVKLGKIPESAEIVYHQDGFVYVMDRNGENVTQITFGEPRQYEHVAISHDHRYIVADEQAAERRKLLWLFNLAEGTEVRLLPDFYSAGEGGIDWDREGFIYFQGAEKKEAERVVYKIRYDGTGLKKVTDMNAVDVATSEDGKLVAYIHLAAPPPNLLMELWVINSDGTNPRLVHKAEKGFGTESAHDPEFSPDNKNLVFSSMNTKVPPNFPNDPVANTAQDIWKINLDGTGLVRLTKPGLISIVPDWKGSMVLYNKISDKEPGGTSIISATSQDQTSKPIKERTHSPKWIPTK